jgi:hypothetical protein
MIPLIVHQPGPPCSQTNPALVLIFYATNKLYFTIQKIKTFDLDDQQIHLFWMCVEGVENIESGAFLYVSETYKCN